MVFQVEELSLQLIEALVPLMPRIAQRDKSLADQLRRASSSVGLNCAEAAFSDPGNRRARLFNAAGSAGETRHALRQAIAWRYITTRDADAALSLVQHRDAGHVAGQEIRGALDAAEAATNRAGQRPGQGRLADAGHVLDQQMPAGQHGNQGLLDRLGLADDDVGDALEDRRNLAGECARGVLGDHDPQYSERIAGVPPYAASPDLPIMNSA